MSKNNELLGNVETLLSKLVDEANAPPDDASGPDFSERLKVAEAVTKFLAVRDKLVPKEKQRAIFEELKDDLYGGTAGRTSDPKPRKGSKKRPDVEFDESLN